SAFLSNMSHEIRTPLNSVLGMNEMVLRECDDPKIIGYSENIRSAGTTLLGLINDILDFSKIEAGKIEIIPVDYDLSSLISDLVNMIRPRAEEKGLELLLDIDEHIPKYLHGDEIRIKQIITNILTNAVKYTEHGSVTLSIASEQTEVPDQIDLHVCVRDTGIGMKEEDLKKLFAKFERIDEERNRNIEGTGLGMSITKSLLESMGSAIEVESRFGEGSAFSFHLRQSVVGRDPIGDLAAAVQERLQTREKFAEKLYAPDASILIVDDNSMNLEVFRNLIKLTGIRTDTADSGEQCLKKSMEQKYDLILLDHMMPGMDGIETLKQMRGRENDRNHETPVICLTANAISGARAKYISAGFSDYLTKPIEYEKLEEMLIRYLPQDKVRSERADAAQAESDAGVPPELSELDRAGIIDVSAGIRYCGTVGDYLSVFRMFRHDLGDKMAELEALHAAGERNDYTIKVHALKSSLRTIGAGEISEAAKRLEDAGKEGDAAYIDAHHREFADAIKTLKDQLAAVPMEDEGGETLEDTESGGFFIVE
nr:response regulator [Lachnospiraceae bacterium]